MRKRMLSLSNCLLVVAVMAPLGFFVLSARAGAQVVAARMQQPLPPGTVARSPRQQPCWEVAGISKSAMEQRHAVQQKARSEVEAVCADTSLTPQQRQQKIREIHQQSRQELDSLISPQQMQELKSCQMSRNHGGGHPAGAHPHVGGGGGPCGEMPSQQSPKSPPSGKAEPEPEQ